MDKDLILKHRLYKLCYSYLNEKERAIRNTISEARDAAKEDTKSSAGDKFETGRELMQQEVALNLTRLNELNKLKQALDLISPDQKSNTIHAGSLVYTNLGNYYVAVSAGKLKIDGVLYYTISIESPIGAKLKSLGAGCQFEMNGKKYVVEEVA